MQVVGVATPQVVYVASRTRKFHVNEILVIEDPSHGYPQGEVVEAQSFNRYIPLTTERNPLVEERVLAGLRQVGFKIEEEEINLARVRLLEELSSPVVTGSPVRVPQFHEVEKFLLKKRPGEGLVLGVIRGSEEVAATMPEELREVAPLYDPEQGVLPQSGVPFVFDYRAMADYPHLGIFGGSGSGKSFGLRVLLEELMRRRIPAVVFDPHYEMDFAHPLEGLPQQYREDFSGRYRVFTAGRDVGVAFEELRSDELVALLRAAGGTLTEPMENAVHAVHARGDSFYSFEHKVSSLIEAMENEAEIRKALQRESREPGTLQVAERQRYEHLLSLLERYRDRVGHPAPLKGVYWRLDRMGREKVFQYGIAPVEEALRQRKLVAIRGSSLWVLQIFAAYLVKKLYYRRRLFRDAQQRGERPEEAFPPFVVVTDEAHNFAPRHLEAPARPVFREVAQEGRKYGVFLILATQRPALLDDTVTAQLNTKIVFRTTRHYDISVVQQETDLTAEETGRLPYLPSGVAFVSSAIVGRTVPVRIRAACTRSPHGQNPFEELEEMYAGEEEAFFQALLELLPVRSFSVDLARLERNLGRPVSEYEVQECLANLARQGKLVAEKIPMGYRYRLP